MITGFLFTILKNILDTLVSPLLSQSDVVFPTALSQGVANVQGIISSLDPIFPIATLFICLSIIISIEVAIFGYKVIMWLIKKIPTIS